MLTAGGRHDEVIAVPTVLPRLGADGGHNTNGRCHTLTKP